MRIYGMYVPDNMEEMLRLRKNIVKIILSVFVLNIIYCIVNSYLIDQSYLELKKQFIDKNILVFFHESLLDNLFLILLINWVNIIALISFCKKPKGKALKKSRNIIAIVLIIFINILFVISNYGQSNYGYLSKDDIVFYSGSLKNVKKYDIKNIRYVDIELSHKGSIDNYYIEYEINLDNGKSINLMQLDGVRYKELADIDRVLSTKNIKINRAKLSEAKESDIFQWLQEYPEDLEPFKEILKLNN